MLKILLTRLIQHITSQNSWANEMLQPFSGKSVEVKVGILSANLIVLANGDLAIAGQTIIADAFITISPSLLMRILANDEAAKLQIKIEGDSHLAAELAKVLSNLSWDYEADLSKLVGDVPAHKISKIGRQSIQNIKENSLNLVDMLSEYWQEETPIIAKKHHVDAFVEQVDILRADTERLEKKISKLSQTLPVSSTLYPQTIDTNV